MTKIGAGSYVSPAFEIDDDVEIGNNCVLSGSGRIHSGVRIGHHVVIEGQVSVGSSTWIGHHSTLSGVVEMGAGNEIFPYCSIGYPPQHPESPKPSGGVMIGDRNVLREFVSIHAPAEEMVTSIGDACYLMTSSHISHDCTVGNGVKMAMNATLAGFVKVGDYAYLGLHVAVHQRIHIGAHAMLGMNTPIVKHVPPFAVIFNQRFRKINRYGMAKRGFTPEEINALQDYYETGAFPAMAFPTVVEAESFARDHTGLPVYSLNSCSS
ncbi:hypothetical protein ILT44_20760 [Microvirga sp. BT689]|uniref:hypothetical protein n=1 Tax=Microvirga arvi TaxID=2778731 RepID=UPI00195161F9|nr:hypothetical protein [Microvirga arvi]MBM6582640.1 hypothetical protein [Microvirga arvi]